MIARLRTWLPLLAWMGLIYRFSDQPDLPQVASSWLDFLIKKGLHATAYGILAWLWWRALCAAGWRRPLRWALGLSLLYAASDEWHQTFVPGRHGQVTDVVIDGLGALAASVWLRRPRL
ncbi:MAG: VanZ family protein [Caldilineae bacterium]|nr:VanZ family protein [Chloroflexota bacterium]MCB9176016.1 VanZ family protein [Caldilineae bacterium]